MAVQDKYKDTLSYTPCADEFEVLVSGFTYIKRNIEPLHLEDILKQNQVIDNDMADEIRHKETRSKRFEHLFLHIMRSESRDVAKSFISSLSMEYPLVKLELENTFTKRKHYAAPPDFFKEAESKLQRSKSIIIKRLNTRDVLDACLESFILPIDDFELICSLATKREKAKAFFDILIQHIPESFFAFLNIIKGIEKYKDIVQYLESDGADDTDQEYERKPVNIFNISSRSFDVVEDSNRYQMCLVFNGPNLMELKRLQQEILQCISRNDKNSIQYLSSTIDWSGIGSIRLLMRVERKCSDMNITHYINPFNIEHFLQVTLEDEVKSMSVSSGTLKIQVTVEMEPGEETISDEAAVTKLESQGSVIQENWKYLTEELEPLQIIPLMAETGIELFSDTPMQQLQSREERVSLFLQRLDEVGHEAIQTFIDVLDTGFWGKLRSCLLPSSYDIQAVRQNLFDNFAHIVEELEPIDLLEKLTQRLYLSQGLMTKIRQIDVPREERANALLLAFLRSGDDCIAALVDSIRDCRENYVFDILTSAAKSYPAKLKDMRLKKQKERFSLYKSRKSFEDTEIGIMRRELTNLYAEVLRTLNNLEENTKTIRMPQEDMKIYEGEFIVVVGTGNIENLDEESLTNEVPKWKAILEDIKRIE